MAPAKPVSLRRWVNGKQSNKIHDISESGTGSVFLPGYSVAYAKSVKQMREREICPCRIYGNENRDFWSKGEHYVDKNDAINRHMRHLRDQFRTAGDNKHQLIRGWARSGRQARTFGKVYNDRVAGGMPRMWICVLPGIRPARENHERMAEV